MKICEKMWKDVKSIDIHSTNCNNNAWEIIKHGMSLIRIHPIVTTKHQVYQVPSASFHPNGWTMLNTFINAFPGLKLMRSRACTLRYPGALESSGERTSGFRVKWGKRNIIHSAIHCTIARYSADILQIFCRYSVDILWIFCRDSVDILWIFCRYSVDIWSVLRLYCKMLASLECENLKLPMLLPA